MLQSTPLRGPTSSFAHFRLGIGSDTIVTSRPGSITSRARSTIVARYCPLWAYHSLTALIPNCHIPAQGPPHPGPVHHHRTILSALGPDHVIMVLFLGTHTRTSQWVTHHGSALVRYSLNFRVPMNSEASELPKSLVLGRDENIHLRITPLGDVGCHNMNKIKEFKYN
ncbi:hypothetical protein DVH24_032692 [Malus domestica]|uniref:Uncharacterized protein n=1 Tax=Malus domestica TaxID=3750 RepID=A0A498J6G1_MALDO|nr:hypothetical protein DVH24_032692 [Malus domestica]